MADGGLQVIEAISGRDKEKNRIKYLVQWADGASTWEFRTDLLQDGCRDLLDAYEAELAAKGETRGRSRKPRGRGSSPRDDAVFRAHRGSVSSDLSGSEGEQHEEEEEDGEEVADEVRPRASAAARPSPARVVAGLAPLPTSSSFGDSAARGRSPSPGPRAGVSPSIAAYAPMQSFASLGSSLFSLSPQPPRFSPTPARSPAPPTHSAPASPAVAANAGATANATPSSSSSSSASSSSASSSSSAPRPARAVSRSPAPASRSADQEDATSVIPAVMLSQSQYASSLEEVESRRPFDGGFLFFVGLVALALEGYSVAFVNTQADSGVGWYAGPFLTRFFSLIPSLCAGIYAITLPLDDSDVDGAYVRRAALFTVAEAVRVWCLGTNFPSENLSAGIPAFVTLPNVYRIALLLRAAFLFLALVSPHKGRRPPLRFGVLAGVLALFVISTLGPAALVDPAVLAKAALDSFPAGNTAAIVEWATQLISVLAIWRAVARMGFSGDNPEIPDPVHPENITRGQWAGVVAAFFGSVPLFQWFNSNILTPIVTPLNLGSKITPSLAGPFAALAAAWAVARSARKN